MYELGRYEEALNGFKKLKKLRVTKVRNSLIEEWIGKCHKALRIPEETSSPQNWKKGTWIIPKISLPGLGRCVTALTLDGDDIWIGIKSCESSSQMLLDRNPMDFKRPGVAASLIRYNIRTKHITEFETRTEISNPRITCVHVQNGYVWIGTSGGGIDVYDKEAKTWSNISEKDGLPSNFIHCLAADDTYLWIGTGRVVSRLDLKTKKLHTFLPQAYRNQQPPPTCNVVDMKVAGDFLWCALYTKGTAMYDKKKDLWTYYEHNPYINSIAIWEDRVWFSSSRHNRLWNCKSNGDDWQSISLEEVLTVAGINTIEAYDGQLFIGTCGPTAHGRYSFPGPHGLVIMDMDGNFDVYRVTRRAYRNHIRDAGVTKILPLSANEIWLGLPHGGGVKILKIP